VDSAIEALDFETEPPQNTLRLGSERRRSSSACAGSPGAGQL